MDAGGEFLNERPGTGVRGRVLRELSCQTAVRKRSSTREVRMVVRVCHLTARVLFLSGSSL